MDDAKHPLLALEINAPEGTIYKARLHQFVGLVALNVKLTDRDGQIMTGHSQTSYLTHEEARALGQALIEYADATRYRWHRGAMLIKREG